MTIQFSAGPQALGYLHQTIRYSLYVMMENLGRQECYLRIEKLDDIEVVDGDSTLNSIQVKQTSKNLTNRSTDFWKTIRVWSENLRAEKLKLPETILSLATTAKAPDNSIASLLRQENRQPDLALQRMLEETKNITSSLKDEFAAFTTLKPEQQKSLVNAIQIYDRTPDIEEVVKKIKARFFAVHLEHRDEVFDGLQTWWFSQVVSHLRSNSETQLKVSSIEIKLAELNDRVKPKLLQTPFLLDEKAPGDYDWDNRTFVLQLRLIDLPSERKELAKDDFYRASRLRNWLVDELHIRELTAYDERLKVEWRERFFAKEMPHNAVGDEVIQQKVGREIYNEVILHINIPIHADFTDIRFTRGSYQILADIRDNLEIGWHPNFKEALQKLLTDNK